MRSQLEQTRLFLKPKSRFANIVCRVMKEVAASVLTVAPENFSQLYHYSPIRFVNKSTETPAACKEKQLKLKIIFVSNTVPAAQPAPPGPPGSGPPGSPSSSPKPYGPPGSSSSSSGPPGSPGSSYGPPGSL